MYLKCILSKLVKNNCKYIRIWDFWWKKEEKCLLTFSKTESVKVQSDIFTQFFFINLKQSLYLTCMCFQMKFDMTSSRMVGKRDNWFFICQPSEYIIDVRLFWYFSICLLWQVTACKVQYLFVMTSNCL